MADGDAPRIVGPGWVGNITTAATVLGSLIALGQSGTQFIKGWAEYKTAEVKAKHDLDIQDLKERSSLAESYLDRLLKKDMTDPDKMMLLGALSSLQGHPLQRWAAERKSQLEQENQEQLEARQSRLERLSATSAEQTGQAILLTKLESAKTRLAASRESPQESQKIEDEIINYVRELAQLKGAAGLRLTVAQSVTSSTQATELGKVARTVEVAKNLTVELLVDAVPNAPAENVRRFGPFLIAALKEYQIIDPKLIAYVIATVGVESPKFVPAVEFGTDANIEERYKAGTPRGLGLGNTEPGDGARFKGRGFILITGKANYLKMSARLGLGDLLVQSPDLANDPGIASRIACAFVSDRFARIKTALDNDDIGAARKMLSGSLHGISQFGDIYNHVLQKL